MTEIQLGVNEIGWDRETDPRVKKVARGYSIFSYIRFWNLWKMAISLENTEVSKDLTN